MNHSQEITSPACLHLGIRSYRESTEEFIIAVGLEGQGRFSQAHLPNLWKHLQLDQKRGMLQEPNFKASFYSREH